MTKRLSQLAAAILVATAASAAPALAQSLANRIASAADRSVQFSFPARPGVCGDGAGAIGVGAHTYFGEMRVMRGSWQPRCATAAICRGSMPR